jgi:uncharacterized delta-60 repeat protein
MRNIRDNTENFMHRDYSPRLRGLAGRGNLLKLGMAIFLGGLLAGTVLAQPANDTFENATDISGQSGTTSGSNVGATPEAGGPTSVITTDNGTVDITNTVWFEWTALQSGNVTFDTIGSLDQNNNWMDSVLAVYTGSKVSSLTLITGDDNNGTNVNSTATFLAVGGTTYYIAVSVNADTGALPGNYVLNWNQQGAPASGNFRMTSSQYQYSENENNAALHADILTIPARATVTRVGTANGMVEVNYAFSQSLYTNTVAIIGYYTNVTFKTVYTNQPTTTAYLTNVLFNIIYTFQNYDVNPHGTYFYEVASNAYFISYTNNLLLTNFYTAFATNYVLAPATITGSVTNSDGSITTITTNLVETIFTPLTNYVSTWSGLGQGTNLPAGGTLAFPDFEMNQDISISVKNPSPGQNYLYQNPLLIASITNAALDPLENPALLPAPTIQANRSTAYVSFYNTYEAPLYQYGASSVAITNQSLLALLPAVFPTNLILYPPTNNIFNFERSTLRCNKSVDGTLVANVGVILSRHNDQNSANVSYQIDTLYNNDDYNGFALQAGSDYARPDVASYYTAGNDFTNVTGTLNWGAYDATPKFIQVPITQDSVVKFNQDLQLNLYYPGNPQTPPSSMDGYIGVESNSTLTILLTTQPAGAEDASYNPENNPSTDPQYNTDPGANGQVYASAVQPADGKAIIGGDFTGYNGPAVGYIARINTDGSLDTTFNQSGSGFDGDVDGVTVDANGNIIAVGSFHSYNGNLCNGIARLTPTGAFDGTFNTGFGANGVIWTVALETNGEILAAGNFNTFNQTNYNSIVLLQSNGALDTSFNPGAGPNLDANINSVAVQTNGYIIIGGSFTNVDGTGMNCVARLTPNGSLDTSFNPGSGAGNNNNSVNAVAIQTNGQVLVGGSFDSFNGLNQGGIVRLNGDGSLDSTFAAGLGANGDVFSIALQNDGTIYIGGSFTSVNQTRRIGVARLLPSGWVDTSFMDTAYNQFAGVINPYNNPSVNSPNTIYTISIQNNGNVLVGGSFNEIGGSGGLPQINYTSIYDREGVHIRSNVASLIGGSTPGPGNVELSYNSYSANNNASPFYITMDRTNGTLGIVSATAEAIPLGTGAGNAVYGVDYTFTATMPVWGSTWGGNTGRGPQWGNQTVLTWMLSDGLYSLNAIEHTIKPNTSIIGLNTVSINIISNSNPNETLNLGVTQPQGMNTFFLGGNQPPLLSGETSLATAQGENIPLGVALGNALSPMTILHNNVQAGVFNFSASYYYVGEGAGNAIITVTRTNGSDNTVTVKYTTSNGTALAGTDYTLTSGTLQFRGGVTSQSFDVPILPNDIARPDRVFNVTIYDPSSGSLGTITNAQVEIINDNILSGFAEFENGSFIPNNTTMGYGINENGGSTLITVARLGGSSGVLTVNVASTNGSAINGVNYVGFTNTLTWTNSDSSIKTISVPVMDDNVVTTNLTVNIQLNNALLNGTSTTNLLGVYTNALLVITNVDSVGTVQFTASSYNVNENAGYAIFPVVRTGGSSGTLSVNYYTLNNSATAGQNYTATNGTFVFASGQVSTNFIVPIINQNSPWTLPISFYVGLSNAIPTNGMGSPNLAQVNISGSQAYNNPPGQPDPTFYGLFNGPVFALALQSNGALLAGGGFTQADGTSRQYIARLNNNGTLDTTFSSSLTTSGANAPVQAIVVQTNGLILVGGLFTNFNNTTLNYIARLNVDGSLDSTFNPGAGANSSIYALAQTYVNGQRRILVGGSFNLMGGLVYNSIAQLLDNGSVDTSFTPNGGANGTVYALAVQPNGGIVIGGDFTTVNNLPFNHIARLNPNGSVDMTFSNAVSNSAMGANASVRAIAIQLDGRILIGGLFTNVNGVAMNYIARLNANGTLDTSFNPPGGANGGVQTIVVQPDSRIIIGGNFSQFNGINRYNITRLNSDGTTDPTINFGTGADGAIAASVIETDGEIDLGGSFQNFDSLPHPYIVRIYGGSTAGSGAFQFSSANYQVDENGGAGVITVVRTGGTSGTNSNGSGDVLVNFATSNQSALAGTNYMSVITTMDFPLGQDVETISVPVINSGVVTSNLTVGLALSNPTPPAQLGNQTTSTLTIINDNSAISFTNATFIVPKNVPGGMASITIVRQGSTVGNASALFMTTTNGTAVLGTDYTAVSNVVSFAAGVSNVPVFIPINNNGLVEGNRTVAMILTNPVNSQLYAPSNATLTIVDTVTAPGQLCFAATNFFATESNNAYAYLTVIRTNGTYGPISANFTVVPGTAQLGVNYLTTSGSVQFNNGDTNKTISIQLTTNNLIQGTVYLTVFLSTNNNSGTTLVTPTNATLNIFNPNTGVAFVNATNYFTETNASVPVFVQRIGSANDTIQVNYYTTDGTAKAGTNYAPISGTLTFNSGQSLEAITLPLLYDPQVTGNLLFTINLSNPVDISTPGATVLLTSPTNTVIVDQDADAGLSFTNSVSSVYKNAVQMAVEVVCSNPGVEPVSVNYSTADGTGKAGVNYLATSGTLVFANGTPTNYFNVRIINNSLVSGNYTFSVNLSNPTPPGQLIPPSTQTITIVDFNSGLSFSSPTYAVNRSAGFATITVVRTDNTNTTSTVNFSTSDGTAKGGVDYVSTNGTLTFIPGQVSQSFPITVIASTTVQPDKTVLLQLSNPNNGILIPPNAATLTIHDTSGSYVVPAGSAFKPGGDPTGTGIIQPGLTNTILFGFRDAGGTNVTDLIATLLTTNGITRASSTTNFTGPPTQSYGPLIANGPSAFQPFTFIAMGTNSQQIIATFLLSNNVASLGTALFTYTLGSWTTSFSSTNAIVINANTNAMPYPSIITVSNVGGVLIKATVTLNSLSHSSPQDIAALVVSPAQNDTLIMGNAGSVDAINNLTITFDDAATNSLPQNSAITNGTYKPTVYFSVPTFP